MKRILDYDPLTRTTTYHDYDPVTDTTTIATEQDVTPVLELNKATQNIDDLGRKQRQNNWWHIARIPTLLIDKWKREEGLDVFRAQHDPEQWRRLKRKLEDPEYRFLRATQGKL